MSMKYSFRFFLSLLILLSANALFAGDWLSLAEKVFKSHLIVEVEMKFEKPIPKNWKSKKYDPAGWAFPQALIVRAKKTAKILSVLKSPNEHDSIRLPQNFFVFSSPSPCWWSAHKNRSVKTLLFFTRSGTNEYKPFVGVEQEQGMYTDRNPMYDSLKYAIREALAWHEERMRAVHPEMLWHTQKTILRESANPFLLELAKYFLETHDATDAIDTVWGKRGTEERKKHEARAAYPAQSFCK